MNLKYYHKELSIITLKIPNFIMEESLEHVIYIRYNLSIFHHFLISFIL